MRRFSLASLAALALIAGIPSGASAATQMGQTFAPDFDCTPAGGLTILQSRSPGGIYAAPSDGVITRWSFQAPASGTDLLKFKVARPVSGSTYTVIGESGLVDPAAGMLNSYPIQIPVKTGDIIGFYWNSGNTANCSKIVFAYRARFRAGDVVPPTTASFDMEDVLQLNLSAILEPDCDEDGLGDETQDADLSSCVCKGQQATIRGTDGADQITGTTGRDVITALAGKDKVSGLAGKDLICGGGGRDTLSGGKGKDKLLGQKGRDKLRGGGGKDVCKGGKGDDAASKCEVEKSI